MAKNPVAASFYHIADPRRVSISIGMKLVFDIADTTHMIVALHPAFSQFACFVGEVLQIPRAMESELTNSRNSRLN